MTARRNKILVCVDFQDQSLKALRQCYDLVRFLKAEMVLIYVIEANDFFSGLFSPSLEKVKAEVEERLRVLANEVKEDSGHSHVSFVVEYGKPHTRIVYKAQEINARFIVMGKNGSNQGFRRFLGSNTIHVISEAPCPVISIKGKGSIGYKKIVVPLDLAKETREKVASAISFARFFGSHIYVVSVLTGGVLMYKSRIYMKMRRVQRELEQNGVNCTLKLFKRSKLADSQHVLDYSNEIGADLIMIMTHREGRVKDFYIGAFAHHIINESEIPVLSIIPSQAAEDNMSPLDTFVDPFNMF